MIVACAPDAAPCPDPGLDRELTVRNAHSLAYDERRGTTVLFGGADDCQVRSDVWEWDGAAWGRLDTTPDASPAPRTFGALVYDSERGRLVLFGGNRVLFGRGLADSSYLDDTWVLDGDSWVRQNTPVTPGPRAEAAAAFDSSRDRVVLFGGYRSNGGEIQRLSDTWEWDGESWTAVSDSGPPAGNGAAMAFDAERERLVLFGGAGAQGSTWTWQDGRWIPLGAEAEGRFNPAMTFDGGRGVVVRFGGWDGDRRTGGTWQLESGSWRRVASDGPPPRNHAALAYDRRRDRVVLFGGHDGERVFGDTWEWDGTAWMRVSGIDPRERVRNRH